MRTAVPAPARASSFSGGAFAPARWGGTRTAPASGCAREERYWREWTRVNSAPKKKISDE